MVARQPMEHIEKFGWATEEITLIFQRSRCSLRAHHFSTKYLFLLLIFWATFGVPNLVAQLPSDQLDDLLHAGMGEAGLLG